MSNVLGLPTSTILAWTRSGLLSPQRDARGAYVFSFQDIALLRSARELLDADVPARRVRQALEALRERLPSGRPLSAVRLSATGGRVVVQEDDRSWEPDTGQLEIRLDAVAPAGSEDTVSLRDTHEADRAEAAGDADAWFESALELEATDPREAAQTYRRALASDPRHAEAHVNLGRLLHEGGSLTEAEEHYRAALAGDPDNARARYNLGVVLEDRGRPVEAADAYRAALACDPELAAAHFNLSRLHEAAGAHAEALQHLASYKRLLDCRGA